MRQAWSAYSFAPTPTPMFTFSTSTYSSTFPPMLWRVCNPRTYVFTTRILILSGIVMMPDGVT